MIHYIEPIFPPFDECIDHFKQIYDNKYFTNNGPFVQQLEESLKNYLKTDREIIIVNNATSGLFLATKVLLRKDGKKEGETLIPSFTFPATVGVAKWLEIKYRYIDIDIDTYCIDESLIEKEISNNCNIESIMAVNCFGNVCNVDNIEKISRKYDIKVIYDSAPALGSEYKNKKVGNFGDIEVFSLHATKILPIGEGGFLSVRDKNIAEEK